MDCHNHFSLWIFSFFPILLSLFAYVLDYLTELSGLEMADMQRCILAGVNESISTDDRGNIAQQSMKWGENTYLI